MRTRWPVLLRVLVICALAGWLIAAAAELLAEFVGLSPGWAVLSYPFSFWAGWAISDWAHPS